MILEREEGGGVGERDRERDRERERETSISCLLYNQGLNLQPRYVP